MDLVTQVVLGGAVGYAALGKKVKRKAALWGAVCGLIPDLDVIHSAFADALGRVEYHRTYSHSLLFILLLTPVLARFLNKKYPSGGLKGWLTLVFLSLITHPILDFFTTYGTEFFYPFNNTRIAWSTISVVDPGYTLPLLIFLIIALVNKKRLWNTIGIVISTGYLLFTPVNKIGITDQFKDALKKQHIEYTRLHTAPTILNNILWLGVAETRHHFYIGYRGHLDRGEITFHRVAKNHHLLRKIPDGRAKRVLIHFSDGLFALKQHENTIIFNDMRYGLFVPGNNHSGFTFSFLLTPKKEGVIVGRNLPKRNYSKGFARFFKRLAGGIKRAGDLKDSKT